MASDLTLPRTPIEYYMLGLALVVANVFVLLITGHQVLAAVAMGLFYGLAMALVVVLLTVGWQALRGKDAAE
ncbi:hypothetical protein [Natronorubrum halophilum]|uniref:hypothetical protein n=1 Tax=Natronorubrum halophilum TaxID=1702106 RepID=UPI0010C20DF6|nr:hypothetical protein [Natronorubrum halophilum]